MWGVQRTIKLNGGADITMSLLCIDWNFEVGGMLKGDGSLSGRDV